MSFMLCRDVVLTCSLAGLLVGCSAVGGPVNMGGGGSAQGGASNGSGSGSASGAAGNRGGSAPPILSVAGTIVSSSSVGGNGGEGSGTTPSEKDNCGSQTQNTTHQLVDIVLVLDRSGSMLFNISEDCWCDQAVKTAQDKLNNVYPVCKDLTTCTTRWSNVSAGIESTVSSTPFLQWALKFFASAAERGCGVSKDMEVAIPKGTATAIRDMITNTPPDGYTPTTAGINAAAAYLKGLNDGNPKVILLATDGEPNCGSSGSMTAKDIPGTTTAIQTAFQDGIKTYVIGIGPSTGNLDDFAKAGGTGKHFPATSPQALKDALNDIGTAAISCTFDLTDIPKDMTNTAIYVNKELVEKDDPNGWSFGDDMKSITLKGATCEKIKNERTTAVQVLFGCKIPPRYIP
jgi:Mg-chelatase subunit ChlD